MGTKETMLEEEKEGSWDCLDKGESLESEQKDDLEGRNKNEDHTSTTALSLLTSRCDMSFRGCGEMRRDLQLNSRRKKIVSTTELECRSSGNDKRPR